MQKERQRKALNKKAKQKLSTKTIILIPIYLAPIFLILSKISIVNGMQSAIKRLAFFVILTWQVLSIYLLQT